MNPLVSVIVPVYNTSKYLRQCIDSIQAQTLKEIEIICVDDGSTDNSLEILLEKEAKDSRIRILKQKNKGGGAARNFGMSIANGKYLSFLDSDDFFEPTMLEEAYTASEKHNADITIYSYHIFYDGTNSKIKNGINNYYIPKKNPFSHKDVSENIFQITDTNPWNKLFLHEFIRRKNLRFQEISKCNDVFFVQMALCLSNRITTIDKSMVHYRKGHGTNTQATTYKNPCDIYYALRAVHDSLSNTPEWTKIKNAFINWALKHCICQLELLHQHPESFKELYMLLLDEGFDKLEISGRQKCDFQDKWNYWKYQKYLSLDKEYDTKKLKQVFSAYDGKIYHIEALINSYLRLLRSMGFSKSVIYVISYFAERGRDR